MRQAWAFLTTCLTDLHVTDCLILSVRVHGDLNVDDHHTIEDTGIVLGTCDQRSSSETKQESAAMEAAFFRWMKYLSLCAVRSVRTSVFLTVMRNLPQKRSGIWRTEMVKEFFYAVSYSCGMNLHIKVLTGGNSHHMAEAMFKSFAKALDQATSFDPRITDVLSTKGSL